MKYPNPSALYLVGFLTALAAIFGAPLIGLTVGLGIIVAAEFFG